MSILINQNTRVMTQGITGKTGQFHTKMGKEYANGRSCYVAGVNPKKPGETYEGIPIFATVKEAKAKGKPAKKKAAKKAAKKKAKTKRKGKR